MSGKARRLDAIPVALARSPPVAILRALGAAPIGAGALGLR
jgi:hypothetical protein